MAKPRWYVIQVPTGREQTLAHAIERVAAEADVAAQGAADAEPGSVESDPESAPPTPILAECFSPRFATQKKVHGEWRDVEQLLFPGYLIAVTARPEALKEALRRVPEFTRLLAVGETFVPLSSRDQAWIGAFTSEGARCVPMSVSVVEQLADGDRIVVMQGPLAGKEALIQSVNRRKSLAYLQFEICGRTVTTKVGLAIVHKRDEG